MNTNEFQAIARQFRAGKVTLQDFTDRVYRKEQQPGQVPSDSANAEGLLNRIRDRRLDSHKGDYGRILVVAGSPGMSGAAALTGLAALRSGAGLVTVATNSRCQALVAASHPALMTVGMPSDEDGELASTTYSELQQRVPRHDCIAIGPGLGQGPATRALVRDIVGNAKVPMVIDADAINCLDTAFLKKITGDRNRHLVLTPHPGELTRLMNQPTDERKQQEQFAIELARDLNATIVLKGHQTLVTSKLQSQTNPTGNPGMATAGSGDVLTGVIAALIGQGLSVWEAAVLGCYVHGKAGDLAAKNLSQVSMIATDIIEALPQVFRLPTSDFRI